MNARRGFHVTLLSAAAFLFLPPAPAWALDKQGSAHGGDVDGATTGVALSGVVSAGISPYNPSYAARPDNTGRTLARYAGHADLDVVGRRLSLPLDVNLFSDRDRGGARALSPTELDLIGGMTSTWSLGPGAIEAGARFEHDRSLDRGGASQSYADVRVRYLMGSGDRRLPGLRAALHDGWIMGYATLGWFAYNPNYFARPDNTGRALFRYVLHADVAAWGNRITLGLDGGFFTDRFASNVFRPSELDLTPELAFHFGAFDVRLAYERDMPIDGGGLVQHFVYFLAGWSFSVTRQAPAASE